MGPQYISASFSIDLFNIGVNVPGQIKESSLTFLVTEGKGKGIGEGFGFMEILENLCDFFPTGYPYLELRKHKISHGLKYKSLTYYK